MTWREFKQHIDDLLPKKVRFAATNGGGSRLLFRGHADARWTLQSTLERAGHSDLSLKQYLRMCGSARRFVSNHMPTEIGFDEQCECGYQLSSMHFPNYEYLGFLRHHGFPSPLLDWTESPYVAAFFAFRSVHHGVQNVRIHIYRAFTSGGRSWSAAEPTLFVQGPFARIHERHATQQCWYTVCMQCRGEDECMLASHERALEISRASEHQTQDIVEVCDLPVSERDEVMADLFAMNITPYTLFRSTDSLVETATMRVV